MLQCPKCGRHYAPDVRVCTQDGTPLRADSTLAVKIPVDPLLGLVLDGKYRLDERLGEGGMGTVYRATHLLIERPVAVKVLNAGLVTDEAARERFRREARAAGRLRHTNAIAVTDFGETPEGLVYIVMELLEGDSLREVMARESPFDAARAVSLMLQISAAVGAAHEAGIIHRDLKPANIFLVQRPHAPPVIKVLDFGIAKLATDTIEDAEVNNLTQTGVMIGTPRYMSPEQCDGAKLTPASDVYGLGIILYEMLTGSTPFTGTSPLAVALQHSSKPPRPPRELVSSIPPALEEVVMHALEKQPDERPSNAGEFRHELYTTAERLGLEHSGGYRASDVEMLRNAGTQTASGRLVLDIERLREQRAATAAAAADNNKASKTSDATALANVTARSSSPTANGFKGNTNEAAPPALAPAAVARKTPHAYSRIHVLLHQRRTWLQWLRQPRVVLGLGVGALLLLVGVAALVRNRAGNEESALASDSQVAASAERARPTPAPTPVETQEERERRRETPNKARPERRNNRQQPPPKKPSKLSNALKKVKKIFKNPF